MAGLALLERRVEHPEATIVCVHGGLDRGGSFARLARRTERFDLVAYDRRGYQASRELRPLGFERDIADLVDVARREAARGPVIALGHSFGGVVTLGAAVSEPSLFELAVLYEAPLPWILPRDRARPPLGANPATEAEHFFRRIVSNGAWERLSERERDSRRLDGPALVSDLTSLRQPNAPFDLAQLTVPCVYVYGDGLLHEYYAKLCNELVKANPGIECRAFANASHGAHLSTPDQLAEQIDAEWDRICESV